MNPLPEQFGLIDIYLFDQLLRGRVAPGMRILDAGCGTGRNLVYLMQAGYEVFGADANGAAIAERPEVLTEMLEWLPAHATEPLVIDLRELFQEALGDSARP